VLLAALTAGTIALVAMRMRATGSDDYDFLGWNLFLAWIPTFAAIAADRLRRRGAARGAYYLAAGVWLAFLPNAPYLVTDWVHLRIEGTGHLGYDVPLLAACSVIGLGLAVLSLQSMHAVVEERLGRFAGWAFVWTIATLVSCGVYLGRVGRLNSWQVVTDPGAIAAFVRTTLADPTGRPRALAVLAACALLFAMAYTVTASVRRLDRSASGR